MPKAKPVEKELVGRITHFFTAISVAVIELSETIKVGDKVSIEGATTNFEQKIDSMQIHNKAVKEAKSGEAIGIKVKERVREGDQVFRL
jgi:putative protease